MALAQWSGGQVTGVDIDEAALQRLAQRAQHAGVAAQVTIVARSMTTMEFPEASFDIIWAEGSIAVIGFKQGLQEWKSLLKSGGYMVIHDDAQNLHQKQKQIRACGYALVDSFLLDEQVWWQDYYAPLAQQIVNFKTGSIEDSALVAKIARSQQEIEGYHRNPERYRSIFYILHR